MKNKVLGIIGSIFLVILGYVLASLVSAVTLLPEKRKKSLLSNTRNVQQASR